jgi:hypothetical protein
MKHLKFRESASGHSENDLVKVENVIGARLPADYRSMLLSTNGGYVAESNEYFNFHGSPAAEVFGSGFVLEEILPLRDAEYPAGELLEYVECFAGRIPAHTIPIGRNAFGDLVLLGFHKPEIGTVYVWDHEHEGLAGTKRTFKNVYRVAASFSEFVENLTVYPDQGNSDP